MSEKPSPAKTSLSEVSRPNNKYAARARDRAARAREEACKPLETLRRAVDATLLAGAEDRPYSKIVVDATSTVGAAEQSLERAAEDAYHKMEVALPALVLVTWFAATVGLSFITKWTLSSAEKGGAGERSSVQPRLFHSPHRTVLSDPRPCTGFVFPVFYTLITTCACLIGCTVILAVQKKTRTLGVAQFKQSWMGICAVAFFTVLGIWASGARPHADPRLLAVGPVRETAFLLAFRAPVNGAAASCAIRRLVAHVH